MAPLYERRIGPRKVALEAELAPWSHCEAALPGKPAGPERNVFVRSKIDPGPLPANDEDIAFAPVTRLSRWIETRKLTSERLTNIYLQRIERFNPTLLCVITPTRELAMAQAKQADQEIAAGHYRGPLHGIPWGGKDLLDTAGIPTTYGAEPFRNRVPTDGCSRGQAFARGGRGAGRQAEHGRAGAQRCLVRRADKESLAAGRKVRPAQAQARALPRPRGWWAFPSAARPAAASSVLACAAGLPGLRPTFGRVPRTGAMTLCWSLDKLGPMTRSVEDAMLVLEAISGPDAG